MNIVASILIGMVLLGGLPGRAVAAQAQDSAAAAAFREARDLVNAREWARAEQRLNSFVTEFAAHREVPAALYWLAFAHKQQNEFPAADSVLTQLIARFPQSPWVGDARAMRVEIAPRLKNTQVIEQGVTDSNEEIKLAALQSLFEARRERAVAIATGLLKPGSGASRVMREGALELLADSSVPEAVPALADVARSDPDQRLRIEAIEALAEIRSESAEMPLLELARSGDFEIRRHAIEALGERAGESGTASAIQPLIALYDSEADERLKEEIIDVLGESGQTAALNKLMQIAAGDASIRLRKAALSVIGDSDHPDAAAFLEKLLK
jgi:HEAT repeat protein